MTSVLPQREMVCTVSLFLLCLACGAGVGWIGGLDMLQKSKKAGLYRNSFKNKGCPEYKPQISPFKLLKLHIKAE